MPPAGSKIDSDRARQFQWEDDRRFVAGLAADNTRYLQGRNMENLKELLVEELKDLYSAEKQIVKALPKIIRGASSAELKAAIEEHLAVTWGGPFR